VLGRDDWLADDRFKTLDGRREHARALLPELERVMLTRTAAQWLALFETADVPASPVYGPLEVFEDPQIRHRQMTWQAPDDGSGRPRRVVAFPVKFSRTPPTLRNVSPKLGQDTDAVLREAGFDDAAIQTLRASRAVA
jgi:formyl-CoA transferase/CoA:oxalate CoA-transferase